MVRFGARGRVRVQEPMAARIGRYRLPVGAAVLRPEHRDIVAVAMLVQQAWRERHIRRDGPLGGQPRYVGGVPVRFTVDGGQRERVDPVDPPAIAPVPDAAAHTQRALDQG